LSDLVKYHSGIKSLLYCAKELGISTDYNQAKHLLGKREQEINEIDLCRFARKIGIKSVVDESSKERLHLLPQPIMLKFNMDWVVFKGVEGRKLNFYCSFEERDRSISLEKIGDIWSGKVLFVSKIDIISSDENHGLKWFLPSILKHRKQFVNIFFVALMLQAIALSTPILFQNLIDKVLVNRSISSLHLLGFAMIGLAIFDPIYNYIRNWLFSNLSSKVNSELINRLYDHLIYLPLKYYNQRQNGDIISRVREMGQVRQFLTGGTLSLFIDLVFSFIFITVMFNYSIILTWIVLASLTLYFLFWATIGSLLQKKISNEHELNSNNTSFLSESIAGIETIKTSSVEDKFLEEWRDKLDIYIRASFSSKKMGIIANQGISIIQKLTSAIVLWHGVNLVLSGDLTAGELIAFNMFSGHVTQPILRLAQVWQDFQHTSISLKRIGDILEEEKEAGAEGLASVPELKGNVEFQKVRFSYDKDGPEVIKGLELTIEVNTFVGITGHSGSGKSTVTRLLQRLYTPQQGQILINGVDLAIADPVDLRRKMSVVLQDNILFYGSISDNIRLCDVEASDEQVVSAAELAGAADFINKLPHGYNTQVGEKGSLLSGGQRQRLAIARALITNPDILILDEATSALDYESEAAVMNNMASIAAGRTVICIAHRLNTLKQCDHIIVLHNGTVAEEGTHNDLLNQRGMYTDLWALQSDE